jgi:hypothetical protein
MFNLNNRESLQLLLQGFNVKPQQAVEKHSIPSSWNEVKDLKHREKQDSSLRSE